MNRLLVRCLSIWPYKRSCKYHSYAELTKYSFYRYTCFGNFFQYKILYATRPRWNLSDNFEVWTFQLGGLVYVCAWIMARQRRGRAEEPGQQVAKNRTDGLTNPSKARAIATNAYITGSEQRTNDWNDEPRYACSSSHQGPWPRPVLSRWRLSRTVIPRSSRCSESRLNRCDLYNEEKEPTYTAQRPWSQDHTSERLSN